QTSTTRGAERTSKRTKTWQDLAKQLLLKKCANTNTSLLRDATSDWKRPKKTTSRLKRKWKESQVGWLSSLPSPKSSKTKSARRWRGLGMECKKLGEIAIAIFSGGTPN